MSEQNENGKNIFFKVITKKNERRKCFDEKYENLENWKKEKNCCKNYRKYEKMKKRFVLVC